MRYSLQHREAFDEAFDFFNGHDVLRLLLTIGVAEIEAGSAIGRRIHPCRMYALGSEAMGALMGLALAAGQVSIGMGLWAVAKMSRILLAKVRRPKYYPQEQRRRERFARERRRVRDRFTISPCPKPEELLAQYAKAGTGAREALRFGSMLCDLEAFCDNSLLRNADGEIIGRNPGVKGWLKENCPELVAHYKNAMRYKGLAEKFRQAAGAADPVPASALVAEDAGAALRPLGESKSGKIMVRMKKVNGLRGGKTVSGTYALESDALEAAWKCAHEILGECEEGADERLRCGKEVDGKTRSRKMPGNGEAEADDRLRRGINKGRRGEVAKLERIIEGRLGGMPIDSFMLARWRTGVVPVGDGGNERASA